MKKVIASLALLGLVAGLAPPAATQGSGSGTAMTAGGGAKVAKKKAKKKKKAARGGSGSGSGCDARGCGRSGRSSTRPTT